MAVRKLGSGRSNKTQSSSLIGVVLFGVAVIAGGYLLSLLTPYILPLAGSAEAQQIDSLFRFMLFIGGSIFLLVEGLLLISVIRFRAKPNDISDGPPINGNTTLEFVWTLIPAIIVTVLAIYAFVVWQNIRAEQPNEQVVHSLGQRFAWTFTYDVSTDQLPPDTDMNRVDPTVRQALESDGRFQLQSQQLHTWVNNPVRVTMETDDVNHSFWIPGMRVKQDLLAGLVTDIRFTPIEAGVYRIVCAELCGSGHGNMAGEVTADGELTGAWLIVHPDEDTYLREFLYPETNARLYPPEDPALRGRQIIQNYACSGCHILDDVGWAGLTGPNLNGLASRTQRLQATGYATMEEYIHASIRHPGEYLVPGYNNLMPAFNPEPDQPNYMPESDLEAIIAYLMTQTGAAP
jgi:cytochrome c oxidase subunit 2